MTYVKSWNRLFNHSNLLFIFRSNLLKLESVIADLKQQAKMQFHRLEAKVEMFNIR